MKNYYSFVLLLSSSIYGMDLKELPVDDASKLQFNAPNQVATPEQLANTFARYPNLQTINISTHSIEQLPSLPASVQALVEINFNNGLLNKHDTVELLLKACPNLQRLSVAHNKLTTLNEIKLPFHEKLETLNCSNNEIRELNFASFRNIIPHLKELNLSGCPLVSFQTKDLCVYDTVPNVHLIKTDLSDTTKKQIIAASKIVESRYCFKENYHGTKQKDGLEVCVLGIPLSALASTPFLGFTPSILTLVGVIGGSAVVGPIIIYVCLLGGFKPEDRETTVFNPIFDRVPDYTEKEVTTSYQRFIRHFPYFLNVCQRTPSDDQESRPLTDVAVDE